MIISQDTNILTGDEFPVSTTYAFYNKDNNIGSLTAFSQFVTQSHTLKSLVAHITSGRSIAVGIYHKGYRSKEKFISSQLIGLDFDDGESVEELKRDDFIKQYAFLVLATPSSTLERPRSRAYFLLDSTINDPVEYEALAKRLLHQYPKADQSCKDVSRIFYGNDTDDYQSSNQLLPIDILKQLPEAPSSKPPQKKKRIKTERSYPITHQNVSEKEISEMLSFIPKQQEYDKWLACLMAVHNAFPNERGIALIEQWSPGYAGEIKEKFDSFKQNGGITINSLRYIATEHGWAPQISENSSYINERYVSDASITLRDQEVLVLKSQMATGKTEFVGQVTNHFEKKHGRSPDVLYMVHRKSLGRNLANRVGAAYYEDIESHEYAEQGSIVCSLNSLYKLRDKHGQLPSYDLLVIDECEQVFAHLSGDTFQKNEAVEAFRCLKYFISQIPQVIAMDAYATHRLSVNFIAKLRGQTISMVINQFCRDRKPAKLFSHEINLISDLGYTLQKAIENEDGDNPSVLLCENKADVIKYTKTFQEKYPDIAIMSIHGDNTSDANVRFFLENINDEIPKYQLLIVSPVIGSGVDVQAPIEHVYAIFRGRSITHQEMMQMLGRYRKTQHTSIFIKKGKSKKTRTTDWKEIYNSQYETYIANCQGIFRYDYEGKVIIDNDINMLLVLLAVVEALRNESMNNIYEKFLKLFRELYDAEDDTEMRLNAEEFYESTQKAKKVVAEEQKYLMLNAQIISDTDYNRLEKEDLLNAEARAGYERWKIETYYGLPITEAIYDDWKNGGKSKTNRFLRLHQNFETLKENDRQEIHRQYTINNMGNTYLEGKILTEMLSIIFPEEFHTRVIPDEDVMDILSQDFQYLAEKYESNINIIFKRRTTKPNDMKLLLQFLLRTIGLRFTKVANRKGGYQLDPETFDRRMSLAQTHINFHKKTIDLNNPRLNM